MSRECSHCGKKRRPGMTLSHSHRRTKRFFGANLQTARTPEGKVLVCTGCIKKGKIVKA